MIPIRVARSALIPASLPLFFGFWSALSLSAPAAEPPAGVAGGAAVGIEELPAWRLRPGETRTLSPGSFERYSLTGAAARAAPLPSSPDSLLIKALGAGSSELWVWRRNAATLHLSIEVGGPGSAAEAARSAGSLDAALETLREVRVTRAGGRAVLRGRIESEAELGRILAIQQAFPAAVADETEAAPGLLNAGRRRVDAWLGEQSLGDSLRTELLGGGLWVRGSAPDLAARAGWEQKLRSLFAGVRLDISTLPDSSRTLFFRVFLLEMKKTAFRELGLDWASRLSGILKVEGGSLFWAKAPEIEVTLRWLEGKGWARVLSQPELVVRVPGEAELFNGGEIPIEVRSRSAHRSGSWVDWKPYGLILRLKALQSTAEQVRLEISSEISELDRANGSESLPALQSSRLKTQVDARIGEPLFLSGLLQEKAGSQRRGWPLLGSIPVLGNLFGSEDTNRSRSELVAVLVPLNAPPPGPKWVPGAETPEKWAVVPESSEHPGPRRKPTPGDRFSPLLERGLR